MTYRASDAPVNAICPAAAHSENDPVTTHRVDEYGTFGTAVHEAAAHIVKGEEFDTQALAAKHMLDEKAKWRLLYMIAVVWRVWSKYGESFCKDDGVLRVLDWKTTRLQDVDYSPQLTEYLSLVETQWPWPTTGLFVEPALESGDFTGHPDVIFIPSHIESCQYMIEFLDDGTEIISDLLSVAEIRNRHQDYADAVVNWDGKQYHPGSHCWYCGRFATCPERQQALATTVQSLGLPTGRAMEAVVGRLSDSECVQAWDMIGVVIKTLQEARDTIKLRAVNNGNTLPGGPRDLVVKEQIRHPLKPRQAWTVLRNYLTDAELAPAVSISKTTALAAIAEKAARSMKGKLKEKVEKELEDAGAFDEERILFPRLVPAKGASNEKLIDE